MFFLSSMVRWETSMKDLKSNFSDQDAFHHKYGKIKSSWASFLAKLMNPKNAKSTYKSTLVQGKSSHLLYTKSRISINLCFCSRFAAFYRDHKDIFSTKLLMFEACFGFYLSSSVRDRSLK